MTPRVSLLITAYNAERFIGQALQSALDQTQPPDEIIVVDDGSTDGTGQAAAGFAGVTVIRQDNQGVGAGRNTGVAASTGDLVAFLDADDVWVPQKLALQSAALAADPGLGGVFCLLDEFLDLPDEAVDAGVRQPNLGVAACLSSCALIPRPVLEDLGPHPTTVVGEWVGWWSQARAKGVREHTVPEVLVRRRIHGANNSLRHEADEATFLRIAREHRRTSREAPAPMSTPVSVIIPVFNRAFCVNDAVQSSLDQDHEGLQVLVVDDGSTDGSADTVAERFGHDPRVRVLRQDNGGPSAARNRGVHEATTDLVTFLDSDDLMPPGRITRQLELLQRADHPDGVIGQHELVVMPGVTLPGWLAIHPEWGNATYWTSLLISGAAIEAVGGFDESLRMGEDVDLVVRLRQDGRRIHVCDDVFVLYRYFGDNLTYNLDPEHSGILEVLRRGQGQRRSARGR